MTDSTAGRRIAVQVLQRVLNQGESLSQILPGIGADVSVQDRAFAQMLVYGVCRWYYRLNPLLDLLMQKPLKAKDLDVRLHLLLALYQLLDTRVPDYASVDAAVSLVKKKKSWAAGLVNGVLRNFIRRREALLQRLDEQPEARFAHPQWLIDQIRHDWPQQADRILEANNRQAPLVLRVNTRQRSVDDYLDHLAAANIVARKHAFAPQGVVLEQAGEVTQLPGYNDGWFSVQDGGAQLAATLMDLRPGQWVLDACAAPGGKTGHMLELQSELNMLALDVSESRLQRVRDNLQRLQLSAQLVTADLGDPAAWWNERPFDRILLDVPCSACGVIRRHPDIKLLRRADDIAALAQTQRQLLQTAWSMLAAGGRLVYATCSVLKQENEAQIAAFLAQQTDAAEFVIDAEWGEARAHGRQILPGQHDMDGFYYAVLIKSP